MEAAKSEPEYNGECALAVMLKKEAEGDPSVTLERDGRTYYFNNAATRLAFKLIPGSAARADRAWEARQSG